jgi:hypothetical protein
MSSGRALALLALLGLTACVPRVVARVEPGPPSTIRLRNESDETVCYVRLAEGERAPDALRPDEVVLPGEERDFEVPPGRYPTRILDCAERELFVGELEVGAEVGARVVVTLEE